MPLHHALDILLQIFYQQISEIRIRKNAPDDS